MRAIHLTQDRFTLVDDEDYEWLNQWNWNVAIHKNGHAYVMRKGPRPRRETISMHRLIVNAPKGILVDHVNRETLDNRKFNLRLATPSENVRNQALLPRNTSGFKGVAWNTPMQKWKVSVTRKHIGYFDTKEEAALAYDKAALEMLGDFARTNRMMGLI